MTDVLFGGPGGVPDGPRAPTAMRVLVTVKAAPNPSAASGETVCVAGLRLDLGHEGWVRLYPINFRFIEQNHTFRKYDVLSLHATPANEGRRESCKFCKQPVVWLPCQVRAAATPSGRNHGRKALRRERPVLRGSGTWSGSAPRRRPPAPPRRPA